MAKPRLDLRADQAVLDRVDALAALLGLAQPGVEVTRSDAARAALLRGLEAMEAQFAPKLAKPPAPARREKKTA